MLGPVMRCKREDSLSICKLFATKLLSELATTSTCVAPSMLKAFPVVSILARVKVHGAVSTTRAKDAKTSKFPSASANRSSTGAYVAETARAFATNWADCNSYAAHASRKLWFNFSRSFVVKMHSCFLMLRSLSCGLPLKCCTSAWNFLVTRKAWPSGQSVKETAFSLVRVDNFKAASTVERIASILSRTPSRFAASSPKDGSKARLMQYTLCSACCKSTVCSIKARKFRKSATHALILFETKPDTTSACGPS
mmetsp:Transcript_98341/g.283789  ORF Transcript_98341/g.283789 Transcript_98341/m.283789 type:complete len:253 (-) Transcript_98341:928-1686(-)